MEPGSRKNAQSWPYPRHKAYEETLRQSNSVWFADKGYPVNDRVTYILKAWEDWGRNIILPEVRDYIWKTQEERTAKHEGFPLHKYLHHGLSSQAMVFNLIGPLIIRGDLLPLKKSFEDAGIQWPEGTVSARFEAEDRQVFREDSGQPTSIDLVIQGENPNQTLFIESKLVEHEFGGCSVFQAGDCDGKNPAYDLSHCYLHHLGRKYWSVMEKQGFLDGLAGYSPICPFALYYQYFREVMFSIESDGDFVLLHDDRNPTFYCGEPSKKRGLMPFLLTFVPESLKSRIHSVSIQQILANYLNFEKMDWVDEFKKEIRFSWLGFLFKKIIYSTIKIQPVDAKPIPFLALRSV